MVAKKLPPKNARKGQPKLVKATKRSVTNGCIQETQVDSFETGDLDVMALHLSGGQIDMWHFYRLFFIQLWSCKWLRPMMAVRPGALPGLTSLHLDLGSATRLGELKLHGNLTNSDKNNTCITT